MKAAALAFRFRVPIFVSLYLFGFVAPWRALIPETRGTLWLTASAWLSRVPQVGLANASLAVTLFALTALITGTMLRITGTAYLSPAVMQGTSLHGTAVVIGGPYRYVRNPLYLGTWLLGLGTSILMPLSGAVFFLATSSAFLVFLVATEERFLTSVLGTPYQDYKRRVHRFLPRVRAARAETEAESAAKSEVETSARPRWWRACVAEIFPVTFTLCFAALAWRYNAHSLLRAFIICYGFSLVVRSLVREPGAGPTW